VAAGATVLTGTTPAPPVAALPTVARPSTLVAVTKPRSVEPASAIVTVYVLPVSPAMVAQKVPVAEQRFQSQPVITGAGMPGERAVGGDREHGAHGRRARDGGQDGC